MAASDVELVRRAWEAFARGDVEAAVGALDPRVRWYGADAESPEDGCHDRGEARDFIRRALADGVSAQALEFRDAGDRVVVVVKTRTPPEWGAQPELHGEVVTVRDGRICEIVVHRTVEAAFGAVAD
jgi:ketosteroid isomerase-like protein